MVGALVLAAGQPVSIDLARTAAHADLVRSEIVGEHGSLICEAHGAGALLVRQEDGFREVLPTTDDVLLDALARQIDALAAAMAGGPVPDAARPSDAAAALRAALGDARVAALGRHGLALDTRQGCANQSRGGSGTAPVRSRHGRPLWAMSRRECRSGTPTRRSQVSVSSSSPITPLHSVARR